MPREAGQRAFDGVPFGDELRYDGVVMLEAALRVWSVARYFRVAHA